MQKLFTLCRIIMMIIYQTQHIFLIRNSRIGRYQSTPIHPICLFTTEYKLSMQTGITFVYIISHCLGTPCSQPGIEFQTAFRHYQWSYYQRIGMCRFQRISQKSIKGSNRFTIIQIIRIYLILIEREINITTSYRILLYNRTSALSIVCPGYHKK